MKSLMTVSLMAFLVANIATADVLSVKHSAQGKTAAITGKSDGVASELFTILDKAGVQAVQQVEGRDLEGKNLTAYVAFLNGAFYGATLTVDSGSSLSVVPNDVLGGKDVIVTGDVAEELFTDMAKAGMDVARGVDGSHIQGKSVECGVLFLGHARYSCTLNVR